jgi:uncharacterized phage-associated protein
MKALERHKLFEAIAFFHKNTRKVGLVKLFKLLYFMDMLHFQETGRSVFKLVYKALPFGPVPTKLYDEMRNPSADMADAISIKSPPEDADSTATPITIISPKKIATGFLTKREERIARELSEIFRDASADDMSNVSHDPKGPWSIAKRRSKKWGQVIDYYDSVKISLGTGKPISLELLKLRDEEFEEHRKFFS